MSATEQTYLTVCGQNQNWEEVMKSLAKKVQRFLASEDGPTAVEYAVMLALIIVVCLGTITTLGQNADATFSDVSNDLVQAGA